VAPRAGGQFFCDFGFEVRDVRHGRYTSLPEVFSRWAQASSPNLPFHSL
jgi:hypothetical protein